MIMSLHHILHENNDYIHENLRLRAVYYWLSEDYIKLKDYDNALNCIEKFAEHSIKWDVLPEVSTYTSIIFQGETCLKNKTLGAKEILVSKVDFL